MPDACISCSFLLSQYIESGTILRKVATLAETGKMEGKLATRVCKSVLILAAKNKYKFISYFSHGLYNASAPFMYRFFARNAARFLI